MLVKGLSLILGLVLAVGCAVGVPALVDTVTQNEDGSYSTTANVNDAFVALNTGMSLDEICEKGGISKADLPFSENDNLFDAAGKSAGYIKDEAEWAVGIFGDLPGFLDDLYDGNDTYEYPETWLNSEYAIH